MDWRIGRLIRSVPQTITVPANSEIDIAANTSRVGITFCPVSALTDIFMTVDPVDPSLGLGYDLGQVQPYHLTLATHGDLPTRKFRLFNTTAGDIAVVFIEYIAPESLLTLALELLRREYPGWRP